MHQAEVGGAGLEGGEDFVFGAGEKDRGAGAAAFDTEVGGRSNSGGFGHSGLSCVEMGGMQELGCFWGQGGVKGLGWLGRGL